MILRSLFFVFLCAALHGGEKKAPRSIEDLPEAPSIVDLQRAPNNVVGGCVNVISGHYFESHDDLVTGGSNPVTITRFFSSGIKGCKELQYFWDLNISGKMNLKKICPPLQTGDPNEIPNEAESQLFATVVDRGVEMPFEGKFDKPLSVDKNFFKSGIVNECSPYWSGHVHAKNKSLRSILRTDKNEIFELSSSNLERASFSRKTEEKYLLDSLKKIDGTLLQYSHMFDGKVYKIAALTSENIETGFVSINRGKKDSVSLKSSDGREITYHLKPQKSKDRKGKRRRFLSSVQKNFGPDVHYSYERRSGTKKKERLIEKRLPDNRYLQIEYGKKSRVRKLFAPIGFDSKSIPFYSFEYHRGRTEVKDALGFKKNYFRDSHHRLSSIDEYDEQNRLYRKEGFCWKKSDPTLLKTRVVMDAEFNILLVRYFQYDWFGNMVSESVAGNISGKNLVDPAIAKKGNLIPNGCETFTKTYRHNHQNLVSEEQIGAQKINYTYYPNTNRIKLKTVSDGERIRVRYYYEYDANNAVRLEVIDDGSSQEIDNLSNISERQIQRILNSSEGYPLEIQYLYLDLKSGQELLLRKSQQKFNQTGLMTEAAVFDAEEKLIYTKGWGYDSWGRVIEETDALGYKTFYSYDTNGNCILKETEKARFHFIYDFSNRLIKEEIEAEGERFCKTHHYDLKSQKTLSTDIYGNETRFSYDPFGRVTQRILPFISDANGNLHSHQEQHRYNALNHLIEKTDAEGRITRMEYNIFGKPTRRENPDGSIEQWVYNLDGTLKEMVDPVGMRTCYVYDFLQRKIEENKISSSGELLSTHKWNYNAFRLLSEMIPDGTLVEYDYDGAGRQIRETRGELETLYRCDALDRVCEKWERIHNGHYRVSIIEKDNKDQVIEERIEDEQGMLFLKKQYRYDSYGNCVEEIRWTSSGPSRTITEYNALNLPTKVTAPDGAETYFVYRFDYFNESGQIVPYAEKIDSLGNIQISVKNTHDKIAFEQTKNVFGGVVRETRFFYDGLQHLQTRIEALLIDEKEEKKIVTTFEYDSMGREIAIFEAHSDPEQKVTRRSYTQSGNLEKIYKPDGVIVHHKYDALGRLSDLCSSDNSVAIHYTYDLADRILSAQDKNAITIRRYNLSGFMEEEVFDHGAAVGYKYDDMGRLKRLILPDQSDICYEYNAGYLKDVTRGENHHSYIYDLSGKLGKVKTPVTGITYSYDSCLRPTRITSHYRDTRLEYDPLGNIIRTSQDSSIQEYSYDALQQLTKESGKETHHYQYDSLGNRLGKDRVAYTNNGLNQLLKQGEMTYEYDLNGNLIRTSRGQDFTEHRYDALDRLIEVRHGQETIRYTYDPFHRRTKKKVLTPDTEKEELYFYQGDKECGTVSDTGAILELKVMGIGCRGDVGAAVFMELGGKSYAPLHDYRGNVILLCDLSGNVIESYEYTAFGEETVSGTPINPWRFSSKRVDPETGWVYFGQRFYDPKIGRWTTPDPLWFADGTNLYCYVQNRPTVFIDPDGLFGEWVWDEVKGAFKVPYDTTLGIGLEQHYFYHYYYGDDYSKNVNYGCAELPKDGSSGIDQRSHIVYRKKSDFYGPVRIIYQNGIFNSLEDLQKTLDYIDELGFHAGLSATYNGSHGLWDIFECIGNLYFHTHTRPVTLLTKQLDDYFANCVEKGIVIILCHSQGAIQTRNALEGYNPEYRNRIHVVAVAPAAYTDRSLCASVQHLTSSADFVHKFDFNGAQRCRDTTVNLQRHKSESRWFDHSFKSQTFRDAIQESIKEIIGNNKKQVL